MLGVVVLDEVLEDGAGLPESDARVRVLDGGDAAVGVDGDVLGVLGIADGDVDDGVRDGELFQDHGDFGGVRPVLAPYFDGLE